MSHDEFPTDDPAVVTVGLLYANGPMHIGHLRGYVTGDVFARALRTLGQETAFVCASDMHGTPVAVNAEQEGKDPEEYALEWHETNAATYPEYNIDFDYYGHTREDTNWELSQAFVRAWEEGGHVVDKEIKVAWDPELDQPLPDRYVEGTCPYCGAHARGDECDEGCQRHLEPGEIEDPTSVVTGNPAEYRTREHKFLRLSDFQDYLRKFIDRLEGTENARNQPREWIEGELENLCITRDMDWGIPYPDDDEGRVLYVWVDAPIEYVSATKDYSETVNDDYDWAEPWRDGDGEIVHVIGKDIIQHHTVFWPAMLKGAGFNEPRAVAATGFVTLDGKNLSTSRNRAIWADEYLQEGFHPDLMRYYVTTAGGTQQDVDFSWDRFAERVNAELVGDVGNFLYRSLLFAHRNYGGTPDAEVSDEVRERIEDAAEQYRAAVNDYSVRKLGDVSLELARFGNEYIQRHEPWKLVDEDAAAAAQVIRDCVQLSKAVAVLFEPIAPGKAAELWAQLEADGAAEDATLEDALAAPPREFGAPEELFEGVEEGRVEELNAKLQAKVEAAAEAGADEGEEAAADTATEAGAAAETAGEDAGAVATETDEAEASEAGDVEPIEDERISFEDFQDLDVRVGRIESAEPIEGSDDLVVLQVDIGPEIRQVVAGIKQLHDVEELPGTKVVVLANLESAELFGRESDGMILAAGEQADLLTTHGDAEPGERVR
jgi:methionyl-tRNA synthetase